MAIAQVRELFDGRPASINAKGERAYHRRFHVQGDGAIGPVEVSVAVDPTTGVRIPTWGEIYLVGGELDLAAFVTNIRAAPDRSFDLWLVEVDYTTVTPTSSSGGTAGSGPSPPGTGDGGAGGAPALEVNPLLRPADVRYSTIKQMKVLQKDRDGNLITNSANKPFDPPLEMEEVRVGINIVKNYATFDLKVIEEYVGTTNLEPWPGTLGLTIDCVRCMDISAKAARSQGVAYWEVSFAFEYKGGGWVVELLDQGWEELGVLGTKWFLIKDEYGRPLSQPALLDGAGNKLDADENPVFLTFDVYPQKDFNLLNIFPGVT